METMVDTAVHIRWMIRSDLDEVLKIENECFPNLWTEADFISELSQRDVIGKVAEAGELVAGFMLYGFYKDRLELLNFAVRADVQRRGIGAALVDNLKGKLHPNRRHKIVTHVRESNLDAQLFFRSQSFRATRIEPEFYEDSAEDAYRFVFLCKECEGR